ncbi:MAG: SulP family inorganic anion transporter [Candidatus Sericytochromatia bacterium]
MLQSVFSEISFHHLKRDLPASLAVFLVAVPLCLGIAHASNAPLLAGLISGMMGGVVVGFLSKSPLSVSGPAAGLTAIVSSAAISLGSFEALLVATVLAGLFQIALGLVRAGSISSYIPSAVIRGMLSAIGVILILKQLPHLMGYDAEAEGVERFVVHGSELEGLTHVPGHEGVATTFSVLCDAILNLEPRIFAIGMVSIATMVLWDKTVGEKIKTLPSSLMAVVVGTVMALIYKALGAELTVGVNHLVQIPQINSVRSFMAQTSFPVWDALANPKVYGVALTIAFVASIETLLSIEAIDKLDPRKRRTPTNRELIAQGAGNSLAGLLGGLPMTSVIARSSVNLVAGGTTKLSAILHGVWLVLAVVAAAPLINHIPLATLAAVLMMTGFKLASPSQIRALYKNGRDQWIPYLVTLVMVVVTDLLLGVLIGLAVSAVFILYNHYRSEVVRVAQHSAHNWELVFGENLTFLNKARIEDLLESLPRGAHITLDTCRCTYIDHDVMEIIQTFVSHAAEREIEVVHRTLDAGFNPVSATHAERLTHLMEEPQASSH